MGVKTDINNDLKIITILEGRTYECDLGRDLDINQEDINEELANQPSKYAWYGMLSMLARSKVDVLENEVKTVEADITYALFKEQSVASKEEKLTIDGVKSKAKLISPYPEKMSEYLKAKLEANILEVARKAFEQRKDVLISISANKREEMTVDLHINKDKVSRKIQKYKAGIEED